MGIIKAGIDTPRHLQEIADLLAATKKIIVVTGAGISTNCGIPVGLACLKESLGFILRLLM